MMHFEFCTGPSLAATIEFDFDNGALKFRLSPLLCSFYFAIEQVLTYKPDRGKRMLGFSWFREYIWIYCWSERDSSSSSDPWWKNITINLERTFLGKWEFRKELISKVDTVLALPEATYPVHMEFYRCTRYYTRFSYTTKPYTMSEMKMEKGIKVPGKGESEWNCGDDATFGLWCQADSVPKALSKLLETIVEDRMRYGSGISMYNKIA